MKRVALEWVRKAEADYLAATRESRARACDLVCFLAQQSVEKYLKALLEENTVPFPRTHDLPHLSNLALPHCAKLKSLVVRLRRLSAYAVKFRYPGAWATAGQSRAAMQTVRAARKVLRSALGI